MRYRLILFFICFYCEIVAQMRFRHLTVEDGLSQSSVNFVIRDKLGFYWIGTQYGLNRYDGKNIQAFHTGNTPQLADNFLLSALEDVNGNLWFATRNNICRYDIVKNKFTTIVTDTLKGVTHGHNSIWSMFTDKYNHLVFISGKTLYYIPKANLNEENPTIKPYFTITAHTAFYQNNKLYALKKTSLCVYEFEAEALILKKQFDYDTSFAGYRYFTFTSKHGVTLVNNNKVYVLDNDSLVSYTSKDLLGQTVNSALLISDGLLVGTDNGLLEFSKTRQLKTVYQNHLQNSFSLSENKVLGISLTNDSILWVGNANTGVNYYGLNSFFEVIRPDVNKPYISLCARLINDTVLLSGTNNGYDEFRRRNSKWVFAYNYFAKNKITCLNYFYNTLFIGTNKGLFIRQNNQYKQVDLLGDNPLVFDINYLNKEQSIISTILGVYILDTRSLNVIKRIHSEKENSSGISGLKTNYIFNSLVTVNGVYVNSTVGTSLFDGNLNFKSNLFENYNYKSLSEIMITKAAQTNDSTLWFGSLGNGVYKNKSGRLTNINNLTNNVVASIEKDNHQNIWVSTNYGINCVTDNNKIVHYVKELNIESPEFMTNGSCSKGDNLFFCSNSGLIYFDANKLLSARSSESLSLNPVSLTKNYTDTLFNDSVIKLSHIDRVLSFKFCVPTQNYFDNVKLNYILIGFDNDWRSFENSKGFSFTNLPCGEYTLKVKAELAPLYWQQILTYKINVIPPFWKQWWFITLMALLLISLITFVVWYFSRLKLKRQLVQMQISEKVYAEKERISKDLHDNIGTHISSLISGLDKMSVTKKVDNAEKLSDYARNTLSELRQTIWALNYEQIDISSIHERLNDLVFDYRTNYEEVIFTVENNIQINHSLNPEQALTLFRIIQEAMSNSLKHSGCSMVAITMNQTDNLLEFIVTDNGGGFDTSFRKKGHYGLDNMRQRAQQVNISYSIKSEPAKGTTIFLNLKLE